MGLKQYLHSEQEKLKGTTVKQKLEFFWDYYKLPVLALAAVLAVIGSFIHSSITAKNVILSGICLNSYQSSFETSYDSVTEGFLAAQGLDPKKYTVELTTGMIYDPDNEDAAEISYQSLQRIGAQITMGGLDVMIGNQEAMESFAASGSFYELAEVLTQEMLEAYSSYLIVPEEGNTILIDVSGCDMLMDNYPYLQEKLVMGIAVNAPNLERIPDLIRYLLPDAQ